MATTINGSWVRLNTQTSATMRAVATVTEVTTTNYVTYNISLTAEVKNSTSASISVAANSISYTIKKDSTTQKSGTAPSSKVTVAANTTASITCGSVSIACERNTEDYSINIACNAVIQLGSTASSDFTVSAINKLYVKINGTWTPIRPQVKVSGTWQDAHCFVKVSGAWVLIC